MGGIKFERRVVEAALLNPLEGFKEARCRVEYRKDPLTGRWSRINLERAKRMKQPPSLEGERGASSECPFCPENLERKTPLFPEELIPEGRLKVGESTIFPNLHPFAKHHAVLVLTKDHYVGLPDFQPRILADGLKNALRYFEKVRELEPKMRYASINWNHMPPAGASIAHPHLQLFLDERPTSKLGELISKSGAYWRRSGGSFWADLAEKEREIGERFVREAGGSVWLTSYAPQGNNEVLGVVLGRSSIIELGGSEVEALALGVAKILEGYGRIGVESFNMAVFSGPLGLKLTHFSLNLKLISRPGLNPYYTSDCGFMEKLHEEPVVETLPEAVAKELKGR